MNLLAALLSLLLVVLFQAQSFASLLLAMLVALSFLEVALRTRLRPALARLTEERAWLFAATLVLLMLAGRGLRTLPESEGLTELAPRLLDRLAFASEVSIGPPLLRWDQPQSFFVRGAENAAQASLVIGDHEQEGVALGHGVFRFDLRLEEEGRSTWDEAFPIELVVDGARHTQHVLAVRPLAHPSRIGLGEDRACIVSEETDEVRLIEARGALSEPLAAGNGPLDCAFLNGSTFIASRYDSYITRLEAGGLVRGAEIGPGAVALERAGAHLVVLVQGMASEILLLGRAGTQVVARLAIEGSPIDLAVGGDTLFVATHSPARIHRIRIQGEALVQEGSLALSMPAFALAARELELVIATTDFHDPRTENRGNHFIEDQLVWLDAATLLPLRIEPTARRTARQDHAGDVDRGLSPISLAFDAEGALLVAFAGSFELARFPRAGLPVYREVREELGMPRAFVALGGHYLATSASDGTSGVYDRSLMPIRVDAWALSAHDLLERDPSALRLRMGEHAFSEGTRAGPSCQSCHLHGTTDGEAHNIGGRVLAPTLDVRGLEGTAPFLRDGSYPRLGDLYDVAVQEYRGYRASEGDRRATLEAFVRSLPLPQIDAPRDLERERRGLEVFFQARCAQCHAPPLFTNLSRHAARDLFPDASLREESSSLDVPSLRALRMSAPYLFDGRAASLEEVLTTHNAGNRHGDTASLSDAERGDLVFFLETL